MPPSFQKEVFLKVKLGVVTVNLHCQPDGFRNMQGTTLGLSVWLSLESFN